MLKDFSGEALTTLSLAPCLSSFQRELGSFPKTEYKNVILFLTAYICFWLLILFDILLLHSSLQLLVSL